MIKISTEPLVCEFIWHLTHIYFVIQWLKIWMGNFIALDFPLAIFKNIDQSIYNL